MNGTAMFFVFECYSEGTFLFRSMSRQVARRHPVPYKSPELRRTQLQVAAESPLSYHFIACGLRRVDAENLLQQLSKSDSKRETRDDVEMICWHPACGQKLPLPVLRQRITPGVQGPTENPGPC